MSEVPREFRPGKSLIRLDDIAEESNIRALEAEARRIVESLRVIETEALARLAAISVTGSGGLEGGGNLTDSRTISIAANGVTTAKIADANVTTAKIADSNVTDAKLSSSGVTAGTYAPPTSITVNDKGRITAIS